MALVLGGMVVVLVAITVLLLFAPSRQSDQGTYAEAERQYMPDEIARGRLILSEQLLRTRSPVRIVAKPDQVYLTPAGLLVPVETKTRAMAMVYDADRVELSVQAFALRHGGTREIARHPVATYGYVRIKREGHPPSYQRVQLHTDEEVVAMRQRRIDIELRRVTPAGPASPRLCPKCSKRSSCPRQAA